MTKGMRNETKHQGQPQRHSQKGRLREIKAMSAAQKINFLPPKGVRITFGPCTYEIVQLKPGKLEAVMRELPEDRKLRAVCVDVANGYSRRFVVFVESLRAAYPNLIIMAGNVVTPDMTYDLLERGADIVKIGIGPGSVCTTRKLTGVGYPQLSAIMECADAAHGF